MADLSVPDIVEAVAAGYLYTALRLNNDGVKKFDPFEAAKDIARMVAMEISRDKEVGE